MGKLENISTELFIPLTGELAGKIKLYGSIVRQEDDKITDMENVKFLDSFENRNGCTKSEYKKVLNIFIDIGSNHPEKAIRKRAIQDLVQLIQYSYDQLKMR